MFFEQFSNNFSDFFIRSIEFQRNNYKIYKNLLKMNIFIIDWLVENILEDLKTQQREIKNLKRKLRQEKNSLQNQNKKEKNNRKKKEKTEDEQNKEFYKENINIQIQSIILNINLIINNEIQILFRNKEIEDELITLFIKINFDILEISIETKSSACHQNLFKNLNLIISKFKSYQNIQIIMLKITTKIVNLIYTQEPLVNPLSEFIVFCLNSDDNLNKMAVDIILDVSKTVFEDKTMDSQGLKNVAKLLSILSEKSSKTLFNNFTYILKLFDSESYLIRNSIIEIISNIIINLLCKLEDVSDIDMKNNYLKAKDNFIDILFQRIYDKNGYCRGKVLQIFEKLCENNALNVESYFKLLEASSERLKDDKSNVRKRAISLIGRIITMYSLIY
jgi:condensin complex subunit 1